jgi:hypothetical protein
MLYPSDETAVSLRLGDLLIGLVREAQAQNEIRSDLPPDQVVHAITGAYLSVLLEQIAHSTPTDDQDPTIAPATIEQIVDMILSGIAGTEYRG